MMAVLSVSDGELRRLEVMRDVDRGGLPVRAAAQLLGRSELVSSRLEVIGVDERLDTAQSGARGRKSMLWSKRRRGCGGHPVRVSPVMGT